MIVTIRLGNHAGAPSLANVLRTADSCAELGVLSRGSGLGDDLVVQTLCGDAGKTTFLIKSSADWKRYAEDIIGLELKVMRCGSRATQDPADFELLRTYLADDLILKHAVRTRSCR